MEPSDADRSKNKGESASSRSGADEKKWMMKMKSSKTKGSYCCCEGSLVW